MSSLGPLGGYLSSPPGSMMTDVDGGGVSAMATVKPVPMKLFATWEVDRTPPNCIPRLCSLTLTRLVLYKSLGTDLASVVIAVKMQSSKRTLRSNEIILPSSGCLDTELELTFSLQYPHFIKREGNQLQIMLQRRKRYKNRTILGFKTLAVGVINMSQVLQKQLDLELELVGRQKDKSGSQALGKVYMLSLTSQPVDHEEKKNVQEVRGGDMYSDEDEDFSSPEEGSDSELLLEDISTSAAQQQTRSNRRKTRGSKSLAMSKPRIKQKFVALLKRFKVTDPEELEQESGSQKFVPGSVDPEEFEDLFDQLDDFSDSGPDVDTISIGSTPKPSLKPFFCSSKNLVHEVRAVSAQNQGNGGSGGLGLGGNGSDRCSDESSKEGISDSHPETLTDPEFSDPPLITSSPPISGDEMRRDNVSSGKSERDRKSRLFYTTKEKSSLSVLKHQKQSSSGGSNSLNIVERLGTVHSDQSTSPRKVLIEQLSRVLPGDNLPEQVILANTCDHQGAHLAAKLAEAGHRRIVCTAGPPDVRATLSCLVSKIQKFCNTQNLLNPVKVVLIGSDLFINSVLRPYVEFFSSKPPDWQGYMRFFIIPLGVNTVSKYIGYQDQTYSSLFLHDSWRELLEKAEPVKTDVDEMVSRIRKYLDESKSPSHLVHIPIAEAMVAYKENNSEEESSQVFIPFISDIRVGSRESVSMDSMEESLVPAHHPPCIGSPPAPPSHSFGQSSSSHLTNQNDRLTPPSSPHVSGYGRSSTAADFSYEPIDLQLSYWITGGGCNVPTANAVALGGNTGASGPPGGGGGGAAAYPHDANEQVVKSSIKTSICFMQVQRLGPWESNTFSMQYWLKEKKPKNVMRIGKKKDKEKDDLKNQSVEGICRLICLSKGQNPLKLFIDGLEWSSVKFFQLSPQWQTHIKHFPVASFSSTPSHGTGSQQTSL